jgi:hypothetical protein
VELDLAIGTALDDERVFELEQDCPRSPPISSARTRSTDAISA